jgi:predicted ATPase
VGLGTLVTELAVHGWCKEIALTPLGLPAIEDYLKARLGHENCATEWREMAPLLLERTGGNPLFMTRIVNHLAQLEGPIERLRQSYRSRKMCGASLTGRSTNLTRVTAAC